MILSSLRKERMITSVWYCFFYDIVFFTERTYDYERMITSAWLRTYDYERMIMSVWLRAYDYERTYDYENVWLRAPFVSFIYINQVVRADSQSS